MNAAQLINQTSGVYQIRNVLNGNRYIGSAVNLRRRKKDHATSLNAQKHHCAQLQYAWNKYGPRAFVFEVIEETPPQRLTEREQFHLDAPRDCRLYNICKNAYSHLGVRRSPETRRRMAAACVGRKRPPPFSEEHRARIGAAHRGRSYRPETIEKMRANGRRQVITPEQRQRMNAARWANPKPFRHSGESKRKISNSHFGIRPSQQAREKIRKAHLGRKASIETRAKMSAAQRARRQRQ